jgi:RNA-splicing ligase RtcB
MLEYQGKYASCKVMVDSIEDSCVSQIYALLNCPAAEGATIVIMPDVHAGAGCVIGYTSSLTGRVCPSMIGVDIGCGVATYKFPVADFSQEKNRFQRLDTHIRQNVPSGFEVHDKSQVGKLPKPFLAEVDEVVKATGQEGSRVLRSLGSLGGGNHFIELGMAEGDNGYLFLTIHSGSRNFGLQIANFHQKLAKGRMGNYHGMEWLEGADLDKYVTHMKVAQRYAAYNRYLMASAILEFFGLLVEDTERIESVHNYIDFDDGVIRKGAISAREGARVVIPGQ